MRSRRQKQKGWPAKIEEGWAQARAGKFVRQDQLAASMAKLKAEWRDLRAGK